MTKAEAYLLALYEMRYDFTRYATSEQALAEMLEWLALAMSWAQTAADIDALVAHPHTDT